MNTAQAYEPEEPPPGPTDDYPWIRAWCTLNRFPEWFEPQQLQRARTEEADPEVIFAHRIGDAPLPGQSVPVDRWHWMTLFDVDNPETRLWLLDWASSRDLSLPIEVLRTWITPDYARSSTDRGY